MLLDLGGNLLFSVHGGGDAIIGVIDLVGHFLTRLEHLASLSPKQASLEMLPGVAELQNLHPLFIHFPIVLLTLFFVIDLLATLIKNHGLHKVADWFLYLGAVFAGITVATGLIAASSIPHGDNVHEIMETHEHLGITIFSLASGLSIWRFFAKSGLHGAANAVFLFLAGLLSIFILFAADLGGLMVYKYGVAVEAVAAEESEINAAHEHDHNHEDADQAHTD
jgi:uncharacterized membrane protein